MLSPEDESSLSYASRLSDSTMALNQQLKKQKYRKCSIKYNTK
jgi:hypothetical protein